MSFQYIVIDDDPVSNMICKLTIGKATKSSAIKTFTDPEAGLEYIKSVFGDSSMSSILLLDINMPGISGWEFLELYHELNDDLKSRIEIYILSSSVDPRDKERSDANPYVKGHLVKPLMEATMHNICPKK